MPTLKDTELDIATFIGQGGLGLTYDVNLFAGTIPDESPDPSVLVRLVGSGSLINTIGSRSPFLPAELQVLVRGARNGPDSARTLASNIWQLMCLASVAGYILIECDGLPVSLGPDDSERTVYIFNLSCLYAS